MALDYSSTIAYHPKLFLLNASTNPANRSASVNDSEFCSELLSFHRTSGSFGYLLPFGKQLPSARPKYIPFTHPVSDMISLRCFTCSLKNGRYLSMIFGLSLRNISSGISYLTAKGIHTSWIISVNDFHWRGVSCCSPVAEPCSEHDCSLDTDLLCCSFSGDPAAVFCRPV